jgi:MATE family multidrug resistance protein
MSVMSLFALLSPPVRREARATIRLALPIVAAQLSATGMNLIDVLLAGHFSAHVLAVVAVGTSVWTLVLVALTGMMMSVPTSVAQLDGAGRREEIFPLFRQSLWLALMYGVVLMLAVYVLGPVLIRMMGVQPDLTLGTTAFLHTIAFGAPGLGMFFACRGFSEGLSIVRPSFWFGLLGLVLLGPLGYCLMYGKLGFPMLGATGSGLATAIVCWIQALSFLLYIGIHPRYKGLGERRRMKAPNWASMRDLIRVGFPISATLLMEAGLFIATALVIGRLGDHALATHQIALSVASAAFMIPLGLSMAITVRVAHAKGRGDLEGARRAGLTGIGLTLGSQSVSSGAMLLMPGVIVSLYTTDPAIIVGATSLLRLAGLFQLSDGVQVAANGALRGFKDTRLPMVVTFFAYWIVGMPTGVWLTIHRGWGPAGMWLGLLAGLSVAAVLLLMRFVVVSRVRHPAAVAGVV